MHAPRISLFRFALAGALAWMCTDADAQLAPAPSAYVRDSQGAIVRTSNFGDPRIGNLCVRTGYWTPAQAIVECDGDVLYIAKPPPQEARKPPEPPRRPVEPSDKGGGTYALDIFFDFDKTVIKPTGKAALDDLLHKLQGANLEVMILVGHTDSVGSVAYNNKLSLRRAEAVKAYLVSHGVEAQRIYVEGKGKSQPIADNSSAQGRAKNRRVEIEVVGKSK